MQYALETSTGRRRVPTGTLRSKIIMFAARIWLSVTLAACCGPGLAGTLALLTGHAGWGGNFDGPRTDAMLSDPWAIVADAAGNVYIGSAQCVLKKVSAAGDVTTVAGLYGVCGHQDGAGSDARLGEAADLAVDAAGNVYLAEQPASGDAGGAIRKITPAGVVSTLASFAESAPRNVVVNAASGTVHVALDDGSIASVSPSGTVQPDSGITARQWVADLAFDNAGNLHLLYPSGEVDRFSPDLSTVTTISGSSTFYLGANSLAIDATGALLITSDTAVYRMTPGGSTTLLAGPPGYVGGAQDGTGPAARFTYLIGSTVDLNGDLLVADGDNNCVRRVSPTGEVTTFAGHLPNTGSTDGAVGVARFGRIHGLAINASQTLLVTDGPVNDMIRQVSPDGTVSTLAGSPGGGLVDGPVAEAKFDDPAGIAVAPNGTIYVADTDNCAVRRIRNGWVYTVAQCATNVFPRFPLAWMRGLVVASTGSVFVVSQNMIQKVTPGGAVTTFAGGSTAGHQDGSGESALFNRPVGLAIDAADNLYVADSDNAVVRKITPQGMVSTLAGSAGVQGSADGTGDAARFILPWAIASDPAGNVYLGDAFDFTVRKITPDGMVSTVAGVSGSGKFSAGAAPGGLEFVTSLTVSGSKLYIGQGQSIAVLDPRP
jgi:sugar lactone lactonase YvrE